MSLHMLLIRQHTLNSFLIWEFWETVLGQEVVPAKDFAIGEGGERMYQCSRFKVPPKMLRWLLSS